MTIGLASPVPPVQDTGYGEDLYESEMSLDG